MKEANPILKYLVIYPLLYILSFIDAIINLFKRKPKPKNEGKSKLISKNDSSITYRSSLSPDKLITVKDQTNNLYLRFKQCTEKFPDLETMGVRELISIDEEVQENGKTFKKFNMGEYRWMKYSRILKRVDFAANGLLKLGLKSGQNVVLFSETRPEWLISALACFKINVVVVTQYATLGIDALKYGINETEASYIIASGDTLSKIESISKEIPKVTHLIVFTDKFTQPIFNTFRSKSVIKNVYTLNEVEEIGATSESVNYKSPEKDDLCIIMYTSGSTGNPKGVMMTHGNILTTLTGVLDRLLPYPSTEDIYIGYLPLAHVLELCSELGMIINGVRIGYSSPNTITDQSTAVKKGQRGDLCTLRPTLMAAVPAILERITKAVKDKIDQGSPVKRALFQKAFEIKNQKIKKGKSNTLLDKIIFSKINATILGGRLRLIASGGAILNKDVHEFAQVCLCSITQVYGLSETCAGGTSQIPGQTQCDVVGGVVESCEIKLVDWLEGNYRSTDKPYPRGEIWIGGESVTLGYYKLPDKTKEDFHVLNGLRYFATGDIGEMNSDGILKIIDRKKDLVKLQGGEYVSLNKVEAVLKLLPIVENCCVIADGRKTFCICLIQPNLKKMEQLITKVDVVNENQVSINNVNSNKKRLSIEIASDLIDTLESQPNFMTKFNKDIMDHCLKHKLEKFEIPTKSKLVKETWLPITGLVTDSLKLKRKEIEKFYAKEIEKLYA